MGFSVRDAEFRYTEWKLWDGGTLQPVWSEMVAVELYDHRGDNGQDFNRWENENLAAEPSMTAVVARLKAALAAQFESDTYADQVPVLGYK
jgi:hypothetical protein